MKMKKKKDGDETIFRSQSRYFASGHSRRSPYLTSILRRRGEQEERL